MPRPKANVIRGAITALWLTGALYAVWHRVSTGDNPSPGLAAIQRRDRGDLDGAAAVLQQARVLEGRDATVIELLGGIERERGHLAEAEAAFRAALTVGPGRPEAVLGLAEVLLRQGARQPAGEILTSIDDQTLTTPQQRRWLALAAETGDVALLTQVSERARQRTPGDVDVLTRSIEAAEQRHDWSMVATLAEQVMAAAPELRKTVALRAARAYEAAGDLAKALDLYGAADDRSSWLAAARLATAIGEFRRAADLWQRHGDVALAAGDREARAYSFQQAGLVRQAEEAYGALLHAGELSPAGRSRYAWLLNTAHRYSDAWAVAQRLPDSLATLELRAYTAGWAQQDADAAPLLRRWLARTPNDRSAWLLLADVLGRRGDDAGRLTVLRTWNPEALPLAPAPADRARQLAANGVIDEAVEAYRLALATGGASGEARADLWFELGRLLRWNGRSREAIESLREALDPTTAGGPEWTARVHNELARALADAGQWSDVRASVDRAMPLMHEADLLVLGAQAATALAQPAAAAAYLGELAALRPLTTEEQRWLAGQSEEAGDLSGALASYTGLAGRVGDDADQIWEHIGDLEVQRGDPPAALVAYRRVTVPNRTPLLWAKLTHAATRAGDRDAAVIYEEAYAARALDATGDLNAARYHAASGRSDEALVWYERYLQSTHDPTGLHLELARAHLAAGRPGDAVRWAQAGRAVPGTDARELTFAEAQALHLLGRSREAAALLGPLADGRAAGADVLAWLARTAQARGRRIDAYTLFGQALARGARPAAEFQLARGDLAAAGGDLARAARAYEAAGDGGAREEARLRQRALSAQQRPALLLPVERFTDSTGFESVNAGGGVLLWPGMAARASALWSTGRIQQRQVAFARHDVNVAVDRVYPTERSSVAGSLGVETAGDDTHPLWRAEARYQFRSRGSLAAETFRETPWTAESNASRERYNRIGDLAAIPQSFHTTGVKVGGTVPVFEHDELQAHGAVRAFSDGNRQTEAYAQFQAPVVNRPRAWVALQPYAYVEQWERTDSRYFSPARQVTLAVAGRAILSRRDWTVDLTVAPQLLTSETRTGPGYSAVTSVRKSFGGGALGATWMTFEDRRQRYRLNRFTVDATIPLR